MADLYRATICVNGCRTGCGVVSPLSELSDRAREAVLGAPDAGAWEVPELNTDDEESESLSVLVERADPDEGRP